VALRVHHRRRHLQGDKFEEDADRTSSSTTATAATSRPGRGSRRSKTLEDAPDGTTRWVQLRVPVTEGSATASASSTFDGNTVVKAEALRPLFKLREGDYYSEKKIRKGLEKAREVYGAAGTSSSPGIPTSSRATATPGRPRTRPRRRAEAGQPAPSST
jgi:outer membrane protein assembly factor BamA